MSDSEPERSRSSIHPDTLCPRRELLEPGLSTPLVPGLDLSVVYRVASLDDVDAMYEGRGAGYIYARDGHPNLTQLGERLAALEATESAWIGASGMAVESALMLALVEQGQHMALADGVYGKTGRLARELARFGIAASRFDATNPDSLRQVLTPSTRLIFAETISNPLLRVADLEGLARIAGEAAIPLAVDHTFAPLLCRPIDLGADLVVHSVTKLIAGHSDVSLGAVAGRRSLIEPIAAVGSTFGLTGNAFECWLAARGLTTLPVRSRAACATALYLAERLAASSQVRATHYPGLPSHPDHAIAGRIFSDGFGTIVTFDLGTRDRANALVKALQHAIPFAPSLGDVATTLSHPATTSHRGQSADEWARQGITPGLIRLSVGLEHAGDLWRELAGALASISSVGTE